MIQKQDLTEFILKELVTFDEMQSIDENEPLLETGIIDSLGIMKLLAFIEEKWKVQVPDQELTAENFDTISSVLKLIERMQDSRGTSLMHNPVPRRAEED